MTTPLITLGALPLYGTSPSGVQWILEPDGFKGWWGAPASTITPVPRTRANGVWAGDAWLGARNLTVSVMVIAPTYELAAAAVDSLTAAATVSETTLTVVADGTRYATVRRTDELLTEWLMETAFRFSVQLIATDPRKVATALTGSTGLPSSSGGVTFPVTFPVTFNAVTVAGQVALTNPGNIAGRVTLRISGPITGPVVTQVNSGKSLVFASSISIPAGGWIDVDMDARTVLENGTASRSAWVISRGWSGFEPGTNVWAFTAASGTGTLAVTAWPSWI